MAIAVCGVALTLGALMLVGRDAALSAALGAAVAEVNLWAFARIVSALLRNENVWLWTHAALLKMLSLFVLVGLLMRYVAAAPLSMIAGFGALPMGIAIGSLIGDRRPRPED
jgi:hypothetical protein